MYGSVTDQKLAYLQGSPENPGQFIRQRKRTTEQWRRAALLGWRTREKNREAAEQKRKSEAYRAAQLKFEDILFDGFSRDEAGKVYSIFSNNLQRGLANAQDQNSRFEMYEIAVTALDEVAKHAIKRGRSSPIRIEDLRACGRSLQHDLEREAGLYDLPSDPFLTRYAKLPEGHVLKRTDKIDFLKGRWRDSASHHESVLKRGDWWEKQRIEKPSQELAQSLIKALTHSENVIQQAALEVLPECFGSPSVRPVDFLPLVKNLATNKAREVAKAAKATEVALAQLYQKEHEELDARVQELRKTTRDLKTAYGNRWGKNGHFNLKL